MSVTIRNVMIIDVINRCHVAVYMYTYGVPLQLFVRSLLSSYTALPVLGISYHPVVCHYHPDNVTLLRRCLLLLLQEC